MARLVAVRGALQDHLEENPVIHKGLPALLNFAAQICKGLKQRVEGSGSGPLQDLLVKARCYDTRGIANTALPSQSLHLTLSENTCPAGHAPAHLLWSEV